MKLFGLHLQNFKSFRGSHYLPLQDFTPGVYHLRGNNLADDKLGSNGAGKSTLWEAVYWCLYGRTPRALRASGVRTWGQTGATTVRLDAELHGSRVAITRQTGVGNKLTIDRDGTIEILPQDKIDQLVGMNATEFAHSVYLGQGVPLFLDLTAASQTDLLNSVLNLEIWNRLSKTASALTSQLNQEAEGLARQLERIAGQLTTHQSNIEDWEHRQRQFEAQKQDDLRDLEGQVSSARSRVKSLEHELKKSDKQKDDNAEKGRDLGTKWEELTSSLRLLDQRAEALARRERDLRAEIETAEEQLSEIAKPAAKCFTCGQPLSAPKSKKLQTDITLRITEANPKLKKCEEDLLLVTNSLAEEKERERGARQEMEKHQKSYQFSDSDNLKMHRQFDVAKLDLELMLSRLEDKRAETNVYGAQITAAEKEVQQLTGQQEELTAQLDEKRRDSSWVEFWIKGFRRVRLLAVDSALDQLTYEVNEALTMLGLVGWSVEFAIERETKSGGVHSGLTTVFRTPHHRDPIPWESWSGGEAQRLRLAARVGVANLINRQKGVSPSLEIWDEPAQYLSQDGIDELMGLLSARAVEYNRSVWVVDHRSYQSGRFEQELVVEKTSKGSVICV